MQNVNFPFKTEWKINSVLIRDARSCTATTELLLQDMGFGVPIVKSSVVLHIGRNAQNAITQDPFNVSFVEIFVNSATRTYINTVLILARTVIE